MAVMVEDVIDGDLLESGRDMVQENIAGAITVDATVGLMNDRWATELEMWELDEDGVIELATAIVNFTNGGDIFDTAI